MRRSGGAAIPMRRRLSEEEKGSLSGVSFLTGSLEALDELLSVRAKAPFSEETMDFLDLVSKKLMGSAVAKAYPDVVTLGFWLRKASVQKLKERFLKAERGLFLGRGIAFHIAPSNVPVNFAYSLFSGIMTGNANLVRIPSKDFPQVDIIVDALKEAIEVIPAFRPYVVLMRYGRDKAINDILSSMCDTRIIWGGDETIRDIRRSPLPPRAYDVTFSDRFSLSVIDSDEYLREVSGDDPALKRIARDFYNDTYLSDQNACTSPRLIVWTGSRKEEAKELFFSALHEEVKARYDYKPIMTVNKLSSLFLSAVHEKGLSLERTKDFLITRVKVGKPDRDLIDLRESCGFFFEYDCDDIIELSSLLDDERVQTIGLLGDRAMLLPLLKSGVRGIDRVTKIGHTMDFDLLWDGYNLFERLTRVVDF